MYWIIILAQSKLHKVHKIFCNLLHADSTNYLHIAGRPPDNAADYINATMLAVSASNIYFNCMYFVSISLN